MTTPQRPSGKAELQGVCFNDENDEVIFIKCLRNNGLMKKSEGLIKKIGGYGLFLVGLFIASMGVAFSAKAGLGTSPVASLPYSVSLVSDLLTFGGWLNLLSVIQIAVQVIVMKGKCNYLEIAVQTVLAFVYGYLTNLSCYIIRNLTAETYLAQLFFMLLGCIILAFGIWIQVKGNVAMLPGEAMNRAISVRTGKRYENVKILFDVIYIVLSAVICMVFIGRLEGVREGSIIAALLVGNIIKLFERIYNTGRKNLLILEIFG